VHHLPDARKRGLFTEIFGRLAPGGWYLNYDPVRANDAVEHRRIPTRRSLAGPDRRLPDDSRHLLADLLSRHLPQVRFRPPEGTYLAWLDCTALDLPRSPGELVTEREHVTVVDGPAFGAADTGAFRLNFATPQPILTEIVRRIAAALAP